MGTEAIDTTAIKMDYDWTPGGEELLKTIIKQVISLGGRHEAAKIIEEEANRHFTASLEVNEQQPWSNIEILFLEANRGDLRVKEIAEILNRTPGAITSKLYKLRILNSEYV